MAIESREQIKTYFETGDVPTQDQFGIVYDSTFNFLSDSISIIRPPAFTLPRYGFAAASPGATIGAGATGPDQAVFALHSATGEDNFHLSLGPATPLPSENSGFLIDEMVGGSPTTRMIVEKDTGRVGIGELFPKQALDVNGTIKGTGFLLPTGAVSGHVLTSDALGNASWQPSTGGGGDTLWEESGGTSSIIAINDTSNEADGDYALAGGQECSAQGIGSFAFGERNLAEGDFSMAFGIECEVTGDGAFGLGNQARADGEAAFSAGSITDASGAYSTALGDQTSASGEASMATGSRARANALYSFAGGLATIASADGAFAIGGKTQATGAYSTSTGVNTVAQGQGSFAGGSDTDALGDNSFAFGNRSVASGANSFAIGQNSSADGVGSITGGYADGDIPILAKGLGAVNLSCVSSKSEKNRGANADCSVILGGRDNDIPEFFKDTVILGGQGVQATQAGHTYVMNLNIVNVHKFESFDQAQTSGLPVGTVWASNKNGALSVIIA